MSAVEDAFAAQEAIVAAEKRTAADAAAVDATTRAQPLPTLRVPADIMTRVVQPQEYALRPYFPKRCVTAFVGQGKSGKSFVALAACLGVAAGRATFGCEVSAGDAYYFSAEDRWERVLERVREILRDFSDAERKRALDHFYVIDAVGQSLFLITFSQSGGIVVADTAMRIIETVKTASLIVIDPISRINPTREDNETFALLVSVGEKIAGATGAALVYAHHVGKSQARSGQTDLYTGRGGSSLGDNARSVVVLSRPTPRELVGLAEPLQSAARNHNLLMLTHAALSYGREAKPLYMLRYPNGTLVTYQGDALRNEEKESEAPVTQVSAMVRGTQQGRPYD